MIADLIAEGDQDGCTAFNKATTPVMWGQAIEVPESTLKFNLVEAAGDHAARIFNPGAAISGYKGKSARKLLARKSQILK